MNFNVVFFASILAVLYGFCSATYSDCGSVKGAITEITILGCSPDAKRCILKRNTNATMEISFTPSSDSETLTAVVHGQVLGMLTPFKLPNPNGCIESGVTCPVKTGTTYTYVTKLPILNIYPRVTVDIKWELRNSENEDIICAMIPAKIQ